MSLPDELRELDTCYFKSHPSNRRGCPGQFYKKVVQETKITLPFDQIKTETIGQRINKKIAHFGMTLLEKYKLRRLI